MVPRIMLSCLKGIFFWYYVFSMPGKDIALKGIYQICYMTLSLCQVETVSLPKFHPSAQSIIFQLSE